MAPNLSEDEIDDLIYFARADELKDLQDALTTLAAREAVSPAEILAVAKDEGKSSCLHMAAANGHEGIVTALIAQLATAPPDLRQSALDLPNEFGNTPLHWACLGGHLAIVKALLAAGASPATANHKDQIPLDLALFAEKRDVVDHFMSLSAPLEGQNGEEGASAAVQGVEVDGEVEDDGDGEAEEVVAKAGESSKTA